MHLKKSISYVQLQCSIKISDHCYGPYSTHSHRSHVDIIVLTRTCRRKEGEREEADATWRCRVSRCMRACVGCVTSCLSRMPVQSFLISTYNFRQRKNFYYRELLVSEKFFKTRWIPLGLPSPVNLGEKFFLLSRITG